MLHPPPNPAAWGSNGGVQLRVLLPAEELLAAHQQWACRTWLSTQGVSAKDGHLLPCPSWLSPVTPVLLDHVLRRSSTKPRRGCGSSPDGKDSFSFYLFIFFKFVTFIYYRWLCWVPGLPSSCPPQVSLYGGFSCCRAQAPGHSSSSSCSLWAQ